MYHHPNPTSIDIKLVLRYDGIKATQYFSKWSAKSDQVFRNDLLALKLPHPKRENTNLLSYGYIQCVWPSAQNKGLLHTQILTYANPGEQRLRELSIVNIIVKESPASSTNTNSLKRLQSHLLEGAQEHPPFKKPRLEGDPHRHSFENTTSRLRTVDTNPRAMDQPTRAAGFTSRENISQTILGRETVNSRSMMATAMAAPASTRITQPSPGNHTAPSNFTPTSHNRDTTIASRSAQQPTPIVVPIWSATTHPAISASSRCLVPPQSLPTPPSSAPSASRFSAPTAEDLARRALTTDLGQQAGSSNASLVQTQTPTAAPSINTSSSYQSQQTVCPPLSTEELAEVRSYLQARHNVSATVSANSTRPIQRSAEEITKIRTFLRTERRVNPTGAVSASVPASTTTPMTSLNSTNSIPTRPPSADEIARVRAYTNAKFGLNSSGTSSAPATPVATSIPRPPSAEEIARVASFLRARQSIGPSDTSRAVVPAPAPAGPSSHMLPGPILRELFNTGEIPRRPRIRPRTTTPASGFLVAQPAPQPSQTSLDPLDHPRTAIPVLSSQSVTSSVTPTKGSRPPLQSTEDQELARRVPQLQQTLHASQTHLDRPRTTTPVSSSISPQTTASQGPQSTAQLVEELMRKASQLHTQQTLSRIETDVVPRRAFTPASSIWSPSSPGGPAQVSHSPARSTEATAIQQGPASGNSQPLQPQVATASAAPSSNVAPPPSPSTRVSRFSSISPQELARRASISKAGQGANAIYSTLVQQKVIAPTHESSLSFVPSQDSRLLAQAVDEVIHTSAHPNGQAIPGLSNTSSAPPQVNATTTAASLQFVHSSRLPSFSAEELTRTSHQGAEEVSTTTPAAQSRASVITPVSSLSTAVTGPSQHSLEPSLSSTYRLPDTANTSRTAATTSSAEIRSRPTARARGVTKSAAIQRLTREAWDVKREITANLARESSIIAQLKTLDPHCTMKGSGESGGDAEKASDTNNTRVNESFAALGKAHMRILQVERELDEERKKRQEAEIAIADVRRECRAPFIVPSLLDAFLELSRLTTQVTAPAYPEIPRSYTSAVASDQLRSVPSIPQVGRNEPIIPVSSSTSHSTVSASVGTPITSHAVVKEEPDDFPV